MRISDWSSDVCSSDLTPASAPPAASIASITDIVGGRPGKYEDVLARARKETIAEMAAEAARLGGNAGVGVDLDYEVLGQHGQNGRAARRGRGCQHMYSSWGALEL